MTNQAAMIKYNIMGINICPLCKKRKVEHIHHVVFRFRGGLNSEYNLIPICSECHKTIHKSNNKDYTSILNLKAFYWLRNLYKDYYENISLFLDGSIFYIYNHHVNKLYQL